MIVTCLECKRRLKLSGLRFKYDIGSRRSNAIGKRTGLVHAFYEYLPGTTVALCAAIRRRKTRR